MSTGLLNEIMIKRNNFMRSNGREPKFLIVSEDQRRDIIKAMHKQYMNGRFSEDESEECMGLKIAVIRGTSIMEVAG